MRLWLAKICLLTALTVLWGHNLFAHVHQDEITADYRHSHGDADDDHSLPFGHHHLVFGQLDHAFTSGSQDITIERNITADVVLPVSIVLPEKTKILVLRSLKAPPAKGLPHKVFLSAYGLRGPPSC